MIGLRSYSRDFHLLDAFEDGPIRPPEESVLLDWIRDHALLAGSCDPVSVSWTYARWKPGVSVSAVATVTFEDGEQEPLACKFYSSDARKPVADRSRTAPEGARLRPFVEVTGTGCVLRTLDGDRNLNGLRQIRKPGRLARMVEESGACAPFTLKARSSKLTLLRYKPERRAVLAYTADLHRPAPKPRQKELILRLHPGRAAGFMAKARITLDQLAGEDAPWPRLISFDSPAGMLIESKLKGETVLPTGFDAADVAATLLARLHGVPLPASSKVRHLPIPPLADYAPLFAVDDDLAGLLEKLPTYLPAAPSAWVHGDVHPDQFLVGGAAGPRLLDLDDLSVGDPTRDLASWIADAIASQPDLPWVDASGAWLEAYRAAGGVTAREPLLVLATADEIARRAAAAMRRLEVGAPARAKRLLERAWQLSSGVDA